MAKREKLPFSIKQSVLQYICEPTLDFSDYCDLNQSTLGSKGSSVRHRARKYLDDTRRRYTDPVKLGKLLQRHKLDSSGKVLDSAETESVETGDSSSGRVHCLLRATWSFDCLSFSDSTSS